MFLVLFPYLKFPFVNFDTSPYALVLFSIILLSFLIKGRFLIPKYFILILIPTLLSILLFFVNLKEIDLLVYRSIVGYLSVFLISLGTYFLFKSNFEYDFTLRFITYVLYLWIAVGILQVLVDPHLFTFFINRSTSSEARGVTSLAVEPAYFGTHILFIYLLIWYLHKLKGSKTPKIIFLLVTASIIILSQSMTSILVMLMVFFFLFQSSWRASDIFKFISTLVVFFSLGTYLLSSFGENGLRSVYLAQQILSSPEKILLVDGSVNVRVMHPVIAIYSSYSNYFIPFGYSSFLYAFTEFSTEFPGLIHPYTVYLTGNRIFSGFGQAIFELGIFSLCYPLCVYLFLRKALFTRISSLMLTLAMFIILITPITFNYPVFGFFIGLIASSASYIKKNNM
jgi:hypothetical protein